MTLTFRDGQITAPYIDFARTLCDSGQAFRWARDGGAVKGAAGGRALTIRQTGDAACLDAALADYESFWRQYFALSDDYSAITDITEPFFAECLAYGRGLRVLRQGFWEALASFIISQNNNIGRIRGIIERLCAAFGEPMAGGFAFPSPAALSVGPEAISAATNCGYRAEYLSEAARLMRGGFFDGIERLPYAEQLRLLTSCKGVGAKVANCVALFGLHRLEAFPVDVWISRVLLTAYGEKDPPDFGGLGGVAQQYMFYFALNHKERFR